MATPELANDYYVANFTVLLDFVDTLYGDILTAEEEAFSQTFRAVSMDARRLYVRLMMRKGPHFRDDKLDYPEIGDLLVAAKELEANGLMAVNEELGAVELQGLLVRSELEQISKTHLPDINRSKLDRNSLAATLCDHLPDEIWLKETRSRFTCLTPAHQQTLMIYRLLFFGNLMQDLSEFVIVELGLVRYESYTIGKKDRLFQSREVLDHLIELLELRSLMYAAEEMGDVETLIAIGESVPGPFDEARLSHRRDRILNRTGRYLERYKQFEAALRCYAKAQSPPARERSARILERLERTREALDLCNAIRDQPLDGLEADFARHFRPKLQKKLGLPHKKIARMSHPQVQMEMTRDLEMNIEQRVIQHLAEEGVTAFHSENWLWNSLFGLAFWDVVFMPIPGAFFNAYQRGPKDLYSSEFRRLRERAITLRLEAIREGEFGLADFLRIYEQKQGTACHLVAWQALDATLLEAVLERVPAQHMADVFDRFSTHPGEFRTGFPDLFVFGETDYRLMEVKGPGDQLQPNQRRWLRYFSEQGLPYKIARIAWV